MNSKVIFNKATDSSKTAELLIYDVIGQDWFGEGVTAKSFRKELKALGQLDRLDVRINSPGGNVHDGTAIYNALKSLSYPVHIHIDGVAASMASVIAMAGQRIVMHDGAMMMIHNPMSWAGGDARAMESTASLLNKVKGQLLNAYETQSHLTRDEISALMDEETWMDADEAVLNGFAHEITDQQPAIAACWSPEQLPDAFRMPPKVAALLSVKKDTKPMSTEQQPTVPSGPIAATLEELESLKGATPDFVLAQLKAKATLPQAMNAINEMLHAKLAEADKQIEAAKKATPAAPPTKQTIEAEGGDPIGGTKNVHTPGKSESTSGSIVAYQKELRKLVNEGYSADNAARHIRRTNPELIASVREEAEAAQSS